MACASSVNAAREPEMMKFRPRTTIASFFDGLELVEPGLVRPWQWHPDDDESPHTDWLYGAVARKP